MEKKTESTFRTKDIDLICFLRFKSFQPLDNPIEDSSGTRWVQFQETPQLRKAVYAFLSGNQEANLLQEFRRTRSFLLDTPPNTISHATMRNENQAEHIKPIIQRVLENIKSKARRQNGN